MKTQGFDHQLLATDWLLSKDKAALFSIMGAGKTWVMLNLIEKSGVDDVIIICEKSGLYSWKKEIETHTNFKSIFINEYELKTAPAPRLYIFNYDKFITKGPKLFAMFRPLLANGLVILDESVRIKNENSKTSTSIFMACKNFKKKYIMSGLPIPEGPMDIYNQYKFLDIPFTKKSRWEFRNLWMEETIPFNYEFRPHAEKAFWSWLNSNCFRVDEDNLNLPPKNFIELKFDLSEEQKEFYDDLLENWEADLDDGPISMDYIFQVINKLRQVCSGFIYDDQKFPRYFLPFLQGKGEAFVELMNKILSQKDNVVIWYNFKPEQTIISELLNFTDFVCNPLIIDGGTSDDKRAIALNRFSAGERQVLVAQIQTLAKSVTLTSSRYAIYYGMPYSGDDRAQSIKRIHRIGQNKPVFYYDLVANGTFEEKIRKNLFDKLSWSQFLKGVKKEDLVRC